MAGFALPVCETGPQTNNPVAGGQYDIGKTGRRKPNVYAGFCNALSKGFSVHGSNPNRLNCSRQGLSDDEHADTDSAAAAYALALAAGALDSAIRNARVRARLSQRRVS
jgi:hypothetical protein